MNTLTVEEVILVDSHDVTIGRSEKIAAHRSPGLLHRAFSVVLFDEHGRLLLQRRAAKKYHFGGRWANSCCGHPRPGEQILAAAERRVREELGIGVTPHETGRFEYRARDSSSGLVEHELDHVLLGNSFDALPQPDPAEIDDWLWIDRAALERWMQRCPQDFAPWFELVVRVAWSGRQP
jgi:isopentenyl-diphosphate delta-isomerase